ncbi:MAG: septum formation initiator family protein [Treponema sp.]|nr:septum formation initiator family protein [Treponema sp.]
MKIAKYFFALWAGVLIYTLLSGVWGANGYSARRQLEREQQRQEENIEYLRQRNRELEDAMNSLLYDRDALALHAREQGYASRDERFMRIVGLGVNQRNLLSYGELVIASDPHFIANKTIRIISLCSGFSILIGLLIFDILKRRI